jgi:membrane protease YdiL (CAAX protease family)
MSNDLFSSKRQNGNPADLERSVFKAVLTIIVVVVSFLGAQFAGIVLLVSLLSGAGLDSEQIQTLFTDNSWVQFLAILIVEIITVGLVYAYFKLANRDILSYLKLRNKPGVKVFSTVALSYGLYFIVFIAIATLADTFVSSLDTDQMQQIGFENTKGWDYLAVFGALVILPPIAEEIVFRGVLYQKLKQYSSLVPAIVLTSVVFGLAHLEFLSDAPLNWIAALDTFVFSLFLIGVYIRTKSLWAPIMLHALKNGIAFVFLFLI